MIDFKPYQKFLKINIIIVTYIRFVVNDFNYENNMKAHLKRVLNAMNEFILFFKENILSIRDDFLERNKFFTEKINKISKFHKSSVKLKGKDFNLAFSRINDNIISNTKQFSNIYFKVGYFKPIHTICFELIRSIEKYSLYGLNDIASNHILFTLNFTNEDKKQNTIKHIVFNIPLGFGFLSNNPISIPYINTNCKYQYCLVLDLDETLVHFFYTPSGGTFLLRPYVHDFLKELSAFYEITIFTAAMKDVSVLLYIIISSMLIVY